MATEPEVSEDALHGLIRLSRQVEAALVEFNLSLAQYRVLDRLAGGEAAGKTLAEWLAVRPPTVTAIVDGLVARGLVSRTPDEIDRRRVTHDLTEQGRETFTAVSRATVRRLSRVAGHAASDSEARSMVSALAKWNTALNRSMTRAAAVRS